MRPSCSGSVKPSTVTKKERVLINILFSNFKQTVVTYVCGVHHAVVGSASAFHLAIHGVDLAQTRGFVWNGRADFAVGVESLESCLLSLHVQGIVHMVIDAKLFI